MPLAVAGGRRTTAGRRQSRRDRGEILLDGDCLHALLYSSSKPWRAISAMLEGSVERALDGGACSGRGPAPHIGVLLAGFVQ